MFARVRVCMGVLLAATLLGSALWFCGCAALFRSAPTLPQERYAIVVSSKVLNDAAWKAATVDELLLKYPNAEVISWENDVTEAKTALAEFLPAFTAFVVKPEDAGVHFTIAVSHLTRELDEDPYTDTFWGVITGYDAEAARKVAAAQPIMIERALDCSGCDLTAFKRAWRYSEDHRGTMKTWCAETDEAVQTASCDTDNTHGVLERLQKDRVQFLATSGHATQHDWQMGYCGPNMQLRHKDGALIALDTKFKAYAAHTDEPKVYFANGNCLIGDIDKTDCMALSWMRDGGVRQMMGYTVTTWFGAQGWGTLGLFTDTAGMTTAAEAFHFTNAAIVETLERAIETTGATDLRTYRLKKIVQLNQPLSRQLAKWYAALPDEERAQKQAFFKDVVGHLHDRDVVCFYGDPALETRIAEGKFSVLPPAYDAKAETLTLTVRLNKGERKGAVWFRLPGAWEYDAETLIASDALGRPDVCLENMVRFPHAELREEGNYAVTLHKARPMRAKVSQR